MKCFLVNRRKDPADPRFGIAVSYDYAGNTKTLPPESRVEVPEAEAQVALARYQTVGVSVEYEKE